MTLSFDDTMTYSVSIAPISSNIQCGSWYEGPSFLCSSILFCKFYIDTETFPSALGGSIISHICAKKYFCFSTRPDQIIHGE